MLKPKTKVAKRVLEAQKVVVANILYTWKKVYGMDYLLVVKNGARSYYAHSHIDEGSIPKMKRLAEQSLRGRK